MPSLKLTGKLTLTLTNIWPCQSQLMVTVYRNHPIYLRQVFRGSVIHPLSIIKVVESLQVDDKKIEALEKLVNCIQR